jgi:multidrug efflux pump subunit AcrA (membrane-fusion protein)
VPVEPQQHPESSALSKRELSQLPRLLSPRAVSLRAIGVVLSVELAAFGLAIATHSFSAIFGLAFGGIVLWSIRRRAEAQRAITGIERARELLDLNRVDEAESQLDEVLARRATPPHTRPLAAFNRALVALRRARFAEARARLDAVLSSGWLENRRFLQNFAPVVYASAMLVAVLEGDLEAAERYHREGRGNAFDLERHWFVAESFDLARRERFTELLAKFERSWEAIEGTVSGVGVRQLQLLEAYARSRVSEREDHYRGLHSGQEIHALLHGIRPGRFDHLAAQWPELREFMQSHGLIAANHSA